MSQQQPGQPWGPPPAAPRTGWSRRKKTAVWSVSGVAGFLVLMFIIGTVAGTPKKDDGKPVANAAPTTASPSPTVEPTTETPTPSPTTTSPKPSTAAPTTKPPAKPKPKPKPAKTGCEPTRDVIVWMKVPDLPDMAQVLGNYNAATCESTFKWLPEESPTGPGFCTEAAWGSDNPGYDVDAEPAKRPRKVQVAVGPAC